MTGQKTITVDTLREEDLLTWTFDAAEWNLARLQDAERTVLRLREFLRDFDLTLPDPRDGIAWGEIEAGRKPLAPLHIERFMP